MLYCRKNEFFYYYTYELWLSEKKIKEKILLKRFVVKRQTVEVIGSRSVNIDLTG